MRANIQYGENISISDFYLATYSTFSGDSYNRISANYTPNTPTLDGEYLYYNTITTNITSSNRYRTVDNFWRFEGTGFSNITSVEIYLTSYAVNSNNNIISETTPHIILSDVTDSNNFDTTNNSDTVFRFKMNGSKDSFTYKDSSGETQSFLAGNAFLTTTYNNYLVRFISSGGTTVSYTVTADLSNVTGDSNNPTSINANESFTLIYNADTDYTITSCVTNIGTISYSNDNKTATITGTATENIHIIASATADTPTSYTVTSSLSNVTGDSSNPTSVNANESFTLIYTANTGYTITNCTTNIGTISYSSDNKTATITGTATENISVTCTATADTPTSYIYTISGLVNCTANKSTGDTVTLNDTLTITANEGYYFSNETYQYLGNGYLIRYFNKSSDSKSLYVTIDTLESVTVSDITAVLQPTTTTSRFLHIYEVTNDELGEIASKRFYTTEDGTVKDIGEYIHKLFRNYIPISDSNKTTTTSITIGNMSMSINSTDINTNLITIDTSITINGLEYNNNYSCNLYLPLCDTLIDIPINYVFNKTLNIHLEYELYTQSCKYVLYSSDTMFNVGNYNFSCDIPYRTYETNYNADYKYNSPIYTYCLLTITKENTATISDITDEYINGELMNFSCSYISNDDYAELNNIIEQGIYIN